MGIQIQLFIQGISMSRLLYLFPAIALAGFLLVGCDNTGTPDDNNAGGATTTDENGHAHGEGGAHPAHGPHDGHLFEWNTHDLHGEWKHYKDNSLIRVFVLDENAEDAVAVKADSLTVRRDLEDDDEIFELEAEEPNADGEAAVYRLDDAGLAMAMNLGVVVEMKIGDKTYTSKIAAHEPHDH